MSYASTRRCRVAARFTPSAGAELVPPSKQVQDVPARFGIARPQAGRMPRARGAFVISGTCYDGVKKAVNGLARKLCEICKGGGGNRQFPNPMCVNAIGYADVGFESRRFATPIHAVNTT